MSKTVVKHSGQYHRGLYPQLYIGCFSATVVTDGLSTCLDISAMKGKSSILSQCECGECKLLIVTFLMKL